MTEHDAHVGHRPAQRAHEAVEATGAHDAHRPAPAQPHGEHGGRGGHEAMVADFQRRFWVSLVLTVPVVVLSDFLQGLVGLDDEIGFRGDTLLSLAFATPIYFYGGWPFLRGIVDELRKLQPGMMTLIALAISVAYVYSAAVALGLPGEVFFWELATLIDVMLLGHWIEMRSVAGASGALEQLARLLPADAHRLLPNGETQDVPITELDRGERVLVKPGEKVPTDGLVVDGRSSLNEAMLTGESRPVERGPGDIVIGGAVNGEASLTVEVRKVGAETYLSQVMELVRQAQESRSRTQRLADRAAFGLTIVALIVGAGTLAVWLAVDGDFDFALGRAVTVMVITCPHALGLAIPLVVAVSTAISAGNGLLIRDRGAFERARELDVIVFDKTGTLTEGRFGVTDVFAAAGGSEDAVLALAAALESQSEHPIAQGVLQGARERDVAVPRAAGFRAIPGRGVEASVDGRAVKVVSPGYLADEGLAFEHEGARRAADQGKTVVYVLVDGRPAGAVALADVIRAESRTAVEALRQSGVRVAMLTGDAHAVAAWVAGELGLDEYFAQVLPDQKAARVRELKQRGLAVAMVGDGINDAPALVEADVGIAIGAGTDVAIESADIVLVRSDPRDVASIVGLARATYSKMVQNLWYAAGYNIVAIPLAAGVLANWGVVLPPAVGALFMSLSTVAVAVNAQLLRRTTGRPEPVERSALERAPAHAGGH